MTTSDTAAPSVLSGPDAPAGPLGHVVHDGLGLTLHDTSTGQASFAAMAGLALRDNPRRAHLIVSTVLGKHIPAHPEAVLGAGHDLGDAVMAALVAHWHSGAERSSDPAADPGVGGDSHLAGVLGREGLVLGYCETATGLGHAVAQRLGASYLHTTRREHPGIAVAARFEEEHSHATAHLVQPGGRVSLVGSGPMVLVDDELTTGRTALNTIASLHATHPRPVYVLAVLLDARTTEATAAFDAAADAAGIDVVVASVLTARLDLPTDVINRAAGLRANLPAPAPDPSGVPGQVLVHSDWWPARVPVTARHGMTYADTQAMSRAAAGVAAHLAAFLALPELRNSQIPAIEGEVSLQVDRRPPASVLVLGAEEVMYAPTLLAAALHSASPPGVPGRQVRVQSTTRSPVHAADTPGYAVRRAVTFPAPDDPTRESRVHNLADPAARPVGAWSDLRADHIVVLIDAPGEDCMAMGEALAPYATNAVHLVLAEPPPGRC